MFVVPLNGTDIAWVICEVSIDCIANVVSIISSQGINSVGMLSNCRIDRESRRVCYVSVLIPVVNKKPADRCMMTSDITVFVYKIVSSIGILP